MEQQSDRGFAEAIARVARALAAETSAQATLQKMVDLAVDTIEGCDDAGITVINDSRFDTPASTGEVPRRVDQIQYAIGQGPCLDAIREHRMFVTEDLLAEQRWPMFAARTVAETGVHSMLSFRLFLEQDTLGSLNLYSKRRAALGQDSQAVGAVFASHAALAMSAAQEHERFQAVTADLKLSRSEARAHARQAELAVALQRGMLTELPDLAPLQIAARYPPAIDAAEIGGDWYDAFRLPDGAVKVTVGDLAGHDLDAAVAMGQARSILRSLSVDRNDPPGQLLDRFDTVLSQLLPGRTGTCVCARLSHHEGQWQALFGNAGHLPPLLIADGAARYVALPEDLLLGTGIDQRRSTTRVLLPPGSTVLLYTDGLIERRDRDLEEGLDALEATAQTLAGAPIEDLCDELLARLAPRPTDDVCLLAVHLPRQ